MNSMTVHHHGSSGHQLVMGCGKKPSHPILTWLRGDISTQPAVLCPVYWSQLLLLPLHSPLMNSFNNRAFFPANKRRGASGCLEGACGSHVPIASSSLSPDPEAPKGLKQSRKENKNLPWDGRAYLLGSPSHIQLSEISQPESKHSADTPTTSSKARKIHRPQCPSVTGYRKLRGVQLST